MTRHGWRSRLADTLIRWGSALQPARALPPPPLVQAGEPTADHHQQAAAAKLPGVRAPLSIERAVRSRDLTVLKREAYDLVDLAGDYQAWQNDQVRLFDALALVLGMAVPDGRAFDQIDSGMAEAARAHLSALAAEYQRRLLSEQFEAGEKES